MIRSSDGLIFSGFADNSWTSSNEFCKSKKTFLFSLKSQSNEVGITKMHINQDKCSSAMYHISFYRPRFGGGYEFYIANDANNKSSSYSYLGYFYEIPPGNTKTFLVGYTYFKVSEIEVFQII